ncbi:hypothetical protein ACFQ88_06005 [Paenibacillus sp. NPDC056579]|uniref:hypothetical protein n=1 Tax=Paenibacillus sp. NPDC056579 TaxID=3345871 RepID=UPI0036A94263
MNLINIFDPLCNEWSCYYDWIAGCQTIGWSADERTIIRIGLLLSFISASAILAAVLSMGSLPAIFISTFLFAVSIGIIGPVSVTLGMESHGHIAGSASAVLGTLQFALGAVTSPLVGLRGREFSHPFWNRYFYNQFTGHLILHRLHQEGGDGKRRE